WTTQFGTEFFDDITGLQVSAAGDIFLSGNSDNRDYFNPDNEQSDIIFVKGNINGTPPTILQSSATDKHDFSQALVTDSNGNFFIVGSTMGSMPGASNQGVHDVFITLHDSQGNLQWTKQYGTASDERVIDALLVNDTIYVATSVIETTPDDGTLQPPGPVASPVPPPFFFGNEKLVLFAFDKTGNYQWEKPLLETPALTQTRLAQDNQGNLLIATLEPNLVPSISLPPEIVQVRKFDQNGNELDKFAITGEDHFDVHALETDASGNIYVAGASFNESTISEPGSGMGGPIFFSEPKNILTIIKFSADNTEQWRAKVEAEKHARIMDMALSPTGDIYATGFTHGGIDGNSMIGTEDAFLFKVDSFGNVK
ncbi:MAG: hypothetical protein R3240_09325, partial [Gammaproteobacteria bacterium]|nr:hypothetical protein [Gammaproteobacteria bacterium]